MSFYYSEMNSLFLNVLISKYLKIHQFNLSYDTYISQSSLESSIILRNMKESWGHFVLLVGRVVNPDAYPPTRAVEAVFGSYPCRYFLNCAIGSRTGAQPILGQMDSLFCDFNL